MKKYLTTTIGRLRIIAFLEGLSLLALVFVGVPIKYFRQDPTLVRSLGPVHGALFLLFVFSTMHVAVEQKWKFKETTWKLILATVIPFGTFYIDYAILRPLQQDA